MCRIILARGAFDTAAVVEAALAMSTGRTAAHEKPEMRHAHGWGALWRAPDAPGGLGVHRDERPIAESIEESPLRTVQSDFLAVHVRHATLEHHRGPGYTHPLERTDPDVTWYFMHNGYLPTVHRRLGLPASAFDTAEYFQYVVPDGGTRLDAEETLALLRDIPPGGLSGNAFAVHRERAYVIHWSPEETPFPRYFGMYRLSRPGLLVIASEIAPALAPAHEWEPLKPDQVLEIHLDSEWY
ncbi:class II glutamine amidotransferase [Streptomyces sp. NPDC048057]|uniref:class II glutamine amidotransferase n=1 Tax=Streptomyces sp. NPDC048057 TaxID=3155628 RepID=UPI0033F6E0D6